MRTLHADLTTAQQASTRTPYIRLHFSKGSATYTVTTADVTVGTAFPYTFPIDFKGGHNRIISVNHWEEPFGAAALIRLDNYNRYYQTIDLRGYQLDIGYGFDTASGARYSNAAPLKVLLQRDTSIEGVLVTEFYCVSVWAEIEAAKVFPGGTKITGTLVNGDGFTLGETITGSSSSATGKLAIVGNDFIVVTRVTGTFEIAEDADGASASCDTITAVDASSYGPLIYESGDVTIQNMIDSLLSGIVTGITLDADDPDSTMASSPEFAVEAGESIRRVIRQLLQKTKCGMRYEADDRMHILYLDPSAASQYSYNTDHAFFSDFRERALIMPNKVYFVDQLPTTDGRAASYVGSAQDATSVAAFGVISTIEVDSGIASTADATKRAEAWIAQRVAEANQGRLIVPMNCAQEIYDMIDVTDTRANVTVRARVGRIDHRYEPARGIYEIELRLGGLLETPGDMNIGPGSVGWDISDLSAETKDVAGIKKLQAAWQIPAGNQAYIADVDFTSVDQDTVSWTEGTVKLIDGRTQTIDAGSLDLTAVHYLYCIWGNSTLQNTTDYNDVIGDDRMLVGVAAKASTAAQKAYMLNPHTDSILINTDKVMDGLVTELKLASEAVAEAKIKALAVTSGKIAAGAVIAGKIAALAIAAGNIQADAVTADKILAGSVTAIKIDVATLDAISVNVGTLTSGTINGVTIYAGLGNVVIDANGIQITGQYLIFKDGANIGTIYESGDSIYVIGGGGSSLRLSTLIQLTTTGSLVITAGTGVTLTPGVNQDIVVPISTNYGIAPNVNNVNLLGRAAKKWNAIYRTSEFGCPLPTTNSALDALRKIKAPVIAKGDYGERHYFAPESFPSEMKGKTDEGKEDIEITRTLGVLTQGVLELLAEVDALKEAK